MSERSGVYHCHEHCWNIVSCLDDDGEIYHNHDHSSNDQQNKVGNGKDVADKSGSTTAPGCLIVSSNIVV